MPASDLEAATLQRHRPAIVGHCYRMLGSVADADDAKGYRARWIDRYLRLCDA
jgi:hypothetical protein